MPLARKFSLLDLLQALGRIFANGFQHEEPRRAQHLGPRAHKAVLDQAVDCNEDGRFKLAVKVADRLGRLKCPTPAEDGKAPEDRLILSRQQPVAPIDRRPQRLLPLLSVARPRDQKLQSRVEALEERLGRQRADARSRKLQCQWQTVQSLTDGAHGLGVGIGLEAGADRPRSLDKQHPGVDVEERLERVLEFATDAKRRSAGDDEL